MLAGNRRELKGRISGHRNFFAKDCLQSALVHLIATRKKDRTRAEKIFDG